jgi:hypothetical protein
LALADARAEAARFELPLDVVMPEIHRRLHEWQTVLPTCSFSWRVRSGFIARTGTRSAGLRDARRYPAKYVVLCNRHVVFGTIRPGASPASDHRPSGRQTANLQH